MKKKTMGDIIKTSLEKLLRDLKRGSVTADDYKIVEIRRLPDGTIERREKSAL